MRLRANGVASERACGGSAGVCAATADACTVARAFKARADAIAWADGYARELREHRSRSDADPDLTRLTLAQLSRQYLDDPEIQALGDYATFEQRLGWWVEHYGAVRVLRLGPITLRKARDKLRVGREPGTVNRYLSILRACWNWGRATELIPLKLVWPRRLMLKEPQGIVRYLSDNELRTLMSPRGSTPWRCT